MRRFADISRPYNITGCAIAAACPPCSFSFAAVSIKLSRAASRPQRNPNNPARHPLAGR
jgi:hypothetical protein